MILLWLAWKLESESSHLKKISDQRNMAEFINVFLSQTSVFWVLFLDHLTANNLPVISWTQIIRKWSVFVMSFRENTKWVFSSIMPVSIIVSDRFTLQAKKYFYLSFTVIRFYNNSFSNNQTTLNLISFFVALFDMCRCRIVPFPVFLYLFIDQSICFHTF
jgi:hypothetical protein